MYRLLAVCAVFTLTQAQYPHPPEDPVHGEGICSFYGAGDDSASGTGQYTRYYNEAAVDVDPNDTEYASIIAEICPALIGENKTCCDLSQLTALKDSVMLPRELLGKCPISLDNFLSLFCYFTCSPDQSTWVDVGLIMQSAVGNYSNVLSVDAFMHQAYKDKMYNSVKDVTLPAANTKAIHTLCGTEDCTPDKLFNFIGSNPLAPFPITYDAKEPTSEGMEPLDEDTLRFCYEEYDGGIQCSCQDCRSNETCPPTPEIPPPKEPFLVFGYDGPLVILLIIYLALFIVCLVHLAINIHYRSRDEMDPMTRSASIASSYSERQIATMQNKVNKGCRIVDDVLQSAFTAWAKFAVSNKSLVLISALLVIGTIIYWGVLCAGLKFFVVTSVPIDLWSAPASITRQEKDKFDTTFVPFYRTTQVIITAPEVPDFNITVQPDQGDAYDVQYNGLYTKGVFDKVYYLQTNISSLLGTLTINGTSRDVPLQEVCFKPLEPYNSECALISPFQWFQNDLEVLHKEGEDDWGEPINYLNHLRACVQAPLLTADGTFFDKSCLSTFNGPAPSNVALGGYTDTNGVLAGKAVIITIPINNNVDNELNKPALAWEKEFIRFMKNFSDPDLSIAFQAERSIQDELDRESAQDIYTVALSYFLMFAYVAIMLGKVSCGYETNTACFCVRRWFVDSKIVLGLAGVLFVLFSVASSLGIFSYAGYKSTVVVIEVVPFLVLAVGVDNIFILVQALQRDIKSPSETSNEQIIRIFADVGPSMLLSAFSEVIAFACGTLSNQPAVHDFALYASIAVLINFLLQISAFLVLLAMDREREHGNRFDVLCCLKAPAAIHIPDGTPKPSSPLYLLVRKVFVPVLLGSTVMRFLVMSFFGLIFCLSLAAIPHVSIGLDQQLALPTDSYMGKYFTFMSNYLEVGPPVYFVVEGKEGKLLDVSNKEGQNEVCGVSGCHKSSVVNTLSMYSTLPQYSRINQASNSWIDDYFSWLEPFTGCCRLHANGTFCPSYDRISNCTNCIDEADYRSHRPSPDDFTKHLTDYLSDNPTNDFCIKGGHAAYGNAVSYNKDITVQSSYFFTYHTVCRNSSDFIDAYKQARNLSILMSESMENSTVYPYSIFYVYYEQYIDIVHQTAMNLGICVLAVFLVSVVLLNFNVIAALMTTFTVAMITVNMFGMMYLWDINLNAVSLVNLVMSVGISVEFCSHITRSFAMSRQPDKVDRAREALTKTGSSVLSGIFMTKLIGISVLAFAKSQIFEIYYFRMYVCIVVLGALHGLVFLPVALTFFGPPRNAPKISTFSAIETEAGEEREPLLK